MTIIELNMVTDVYCPFKYKAVAELHTMVIYMYATSDEETAHIQGHYL